MQKLIRQCFKLIKSLAGNDDCKANFLKQENAAKILVAVLEKHKVDFVHYLFTILLCFFTTQNSAQTVTSGLACVASLTLRSPDNSKILYDAGIPEVIVEIMKLHPDDTSVQKNASWAIRNMVSRSRYQNAKFLKLGAEDILQTNLRKFVKFEYDMKAALRDLGCQVNLKEEWTGKGGMLNSEENQ